MEKGAPTMKYSEIAKRHPLLRTESLDGVLTYWPQKKNSYLLGKYMPIVNENTDKVIVDMHKASRGGMTPMVHMNAETPLYDPKSGRGRKRFEAATFREKVHLDSTDLYDLRRIGTREDFTQARTLMQRRMRDLEIRLANRMEWLRRQVLFDGVVTAELEDGTEFSVKYNHPDYLDPVAGTVWSDPTSEPIIALSDAIDEYELDTGRDVKDIILPHGLMKHLIKNERFRELALRNLGVFKGSKAEVERLMVDVLGIGSFQFSKEALHFQTDLAADAASGAGELTLTRTEQIEPGSKIYAVSAKDDTREKFEVDTVDHDTGVVTFANAATVQRTGGFHAGDPVKYLVRVVPSDRILMFGNFNGPLNDEGDLQGDTSKIEDVNSWGNIVSTRSYYADLENPRPGLYTRSIDNTDGDPPHIEHILGIRALPRVTYNEAWMTFKVL